MKRKLRGCPSWLDLSADREEFLVNPERAKIVRQIFELNVAGLGAYSIAKHLNAKGSAPFGPSLLWDAANVDNILRNAATTGQYQKFEKLTRSYVGEKVPDYYPAVIEEDLFKAAQTARKANLAFRRGRKGRLVTNIFAGLISCLYCGRPVRFHSNGNLKSLVCSTTVDQKNCYRNAWTYKNFEDSFFELWSTHAGDDAARDLLATMKSSFGKQSDSAIYEARTETMLLLKKRISTLKMAAAGANPRPSLPSAPIRRNHPNRYFIVEFQNHAPQIGHPVRSRQRYDDTEQTTLDGISKRFKLSPKQCAITELLARGASLRQTSEKLDITLETCRWHLREIFRRTNVHSQADLIKLTLGDG